MADEKTQVEDPKKETKDEDSYEKRYKDSQTHITKIEQENATLRQSQQKDKELFDTISQYVDWDAVNGSPKTKTDDDYGYVDKETLSKTVKDLQEQMQRNMVTQNFRTKHPDMIPYEDLVGVFLGKTDARRPVEERIEKAVSNVQKLLKAERVKGREEFEKEKKEKTAKEAEASGLAAGKGPKGSEDESGGESFDDYVKGRKERVKKAQGL